MKKLTAFVLIIAAVLLAATACDYADNPKYEDITYREGGLELTLKNDMRRAESEDYDFYFRNIIGTIIFTAVELDKSSLEAAGVSEGASAGEYVNAIIEKNGFDRDKIYYSHDELRGHYSFRYSIGSLDSSGAFYYVVVLGKPGNLWYVEMVCSEDDSGLYLDRFDEWRGLLRTYDEAE